MRKYILLCTVLLAAMIISPLTAMEKTRAAEPVSTENKINKNTVSVLISETGKIIEINEREYIVGVLAAEADMTRHEEALKALATAAFTYLRYVEVQGNTKRFDGADISDDPDECQGYLDADARRKKWGGKSDEYEKLTNEIADAVSGKQISYEGEPVLAVYHELNSGATESAQTVWGRDYPYLRSVESPGDRLSADYSKTVVLTEEDFARYAENLDGAKLSGDAENWFKLTDSDESGYVKKVETGGKEFSGAQFRDAFSLASCNFTVSYNDGRFTVRTLGKGHMVGMSLYGADYMARQGSDYEQILTYYYQNTEIL